jgi:hypothetical protein
MHLAGAILALALSAAAPEAAAPQESRVAVPSEPAARVEGNRVVHPGERVTVRVPDEARYLGSERFKLYGVADAEVHVFAESDANKRLRRLYWVQFESYLPDAKTSGYDYAEGNARHMLWGTPTWVRSGPVATGGPTRAGSDREHVLGILSRAGLTVPAEVMNVRMVQLLDDPQGTGKGMRELMIIYSEDLALTGKTLAELTDGGKPNAAWKPLEQPLIQRATTAVTVERE